MSAAPAKVFPFEPGPAQRAQPHNLDAEKSVLGAVFIKPGVFGEVATALQTDDFFLPAHREVFDGMKALDAAEKPVEILLLGDELKRRGVTSKLDGGESYLLELANAVPTAENVAHYIRIVRDKATLRRLIAACSEVQSSAYGDFGEFEAFLEGAESKIARAMGPVAGTWRDPDPLPDGLPPVPPFHEALAPASLRPWLMDIPERLQCPPDFAAAASMVAMGAVVGRACGIRPRRHGDWLEVPNLWGAIVGRPSSLKTPASSEAMYPLDTLAANAARRHEQVMKDFAFAQKVNDAKKKIAMGRLAKASPDELTSLREEIEGYEKAPPAERRYKVNDTTIEKLGMIMADSPRGIMSVRDELIGWLASFRREGHESDRAFALEAWSGTRGFTCDRVGRGTLHIEACCMSVFGTIQPGPLSTYLRSALRGDEGADGLIQRFQVVVWPDPVEWNAVDRPVNRALRQGALAVFERLDSLPSFLAPDVEGSIPFLRFSDAAQEVFDAWHADLNRRLPLCQHEAFEAHLSKYRKLMPALALLCHLADTEGPPGPVALGAAKRAAAWCEYLEGHARRLYGQVLRQDVIAARALLERLRAGDVTPLPFAARDVYRREWALLSGKQESEAAISMLVDHGFLRPVDEPRDPNGRRPNGRPTVKFEPHPSIRKDGGR